MSSNSSNDNYNDDNYDDEFWFINGLAVNDEARELFSRAEIEERALLAKRWFSKMAVIKLNQRRGQRTRNI